MERRTFLGGLAAGGAFAPRLWGQGTPAGSKGWAVGIHDVTRYGAVGDGEADDTASFAEAARAASAGRNPGVLLIPQGTFRLTRPLVLARNGVRVEGLGALVSVLRFSGAWEGAIELGNGQDPVYGLRLGGFGVASADGRQRFGLRLRKARGFGLHGVTLMGIGSSAGIGVDGTGNGGGCWTGSVDQVTVTRSPGTGIHLRGEVNALSFRGCEFAAAGGDNVLLQGGKAVAFTGCVFEGAMRGAEVRIAPADGTVVAAVSIAQSWFESRASGSAGRGLLIEAASAGGVRTVALRDSFLGGNGGADVMIECRAESGELTLAGNSVVGVKRAGVLRRHTGFRVLGAEGEAYRYYTGTSVLPMLLPGT